MHMSFFWTTNVGDFFFDGLKVNSVLSLVLACGVTALASIIYEAIKIHSAVIRARTAREQIAAVSCAQSESANFLINDRIRNNSSFSDKFYKLLLEACIYFCHSSLSYAIMLAVMLYNGWLFVASIVGMAIGYFLFGHISMKINMENVQARTTNVICSPACPESGIIDGNEIQNYGSVERSKSVNACHNQQNTSIEFNEPSVPELATNCCSQITTTASFHQEKENILQNDITNESEECSCRL